MTVLAVVLVAGTAAWFVLRCTVLAPATGRHSLTPHRGWEGRTGELHALQVGKHTQRIKTCGDCNPWDNTITCNLPAHHGGDRHERRLADCDIQAWTDNCHFPGDDCGPDAHTPTAA